jgi:hypothetical protein
MSSPTIKDSDQENVSFEINSKMVLLSHELGGSYTSVTKIQLCLLLVKKFICQHV